MSTTAEQMRAWRGPALLTYGFRPFFLAAGLWAAVAMVVWVLMLIGILDLPSAFDPVSWHAHEMLFGYLGAVVAGFLLTAVPNWTGRLPVVGWPLAMLAALWLAGRIAVAFSAYLPALAVAVIDLSGLAALGGYLAREIIVGRNWRNLVVLAMLGVLLIANGIFHWQAARGDYAAHGVGLRLGLAAAIMLITVIGGRIVPSFTRNWLVKSGRSARPAPMGKPDKVSILATFLALGLWVAAPQSWPTGAMLLLAGVLQGFRLYRWCGLRTLSEPLVWILHVGYGFIPLGALALGVSILFPDRLAGIAAQHLWMAGAIGTMTLAVMSRAILGHTGQTLSAGGGTLAIYLAVIGAVLLRFIAGVFATLPSMILDLSGLLWFAGFTGFVILYGPALWRHRPGSRTE